MHNGIHRDGLCAQFGMSQRRSAFWMSVYNEKRIKLVWKKGPTALLTLRPSGFAPEMVCTCENENEKKKSENQIR